MSRSRSGLAAFIAAILVTPGAYASWLDDDFYCRTYGCVVIHDGFTFDVYDNYIFATGGRVAPGGRMIPWTGNPFQGSGGVNPVITGTRTEGFNTVPIADQGVLLGIDADGDGTAERFVNDLDGDGFLSLGDTLDAFTLDQATDLVAATTSAQRSFYISSRTDFYLTAQARLLGAQDDLNAASRLSDIGFSYAITRNGNDDGMAFGSDARTGNYIGRLNSVDDVGDMFGGPIRLYEFRNAIRRRNSNSLPAQSIRFDYVYGFEGYDLSMGQGHLHYEIEFDVYNR